MKCARETKQQKAGKKRGIIAYQIKLKQSSSVNIEYDIITQLSPALVIIRAPYGPRCKTIQKLDTKRGASPKRIQWHSSPVTIQTRIETIQTLFRRFFGGVGKWHKLVRAWRRIPVARE